MTSAIFIITVFLLLIFWITCLKKFTKKSSVISYSILIWLTLTGALSFFGFFQRFDQLPPRIALAIIPVIGVIILISTSKKTTAFITHIPQTWLINIQSFRVLIELILWRLVTTNIAPDIMSWHGRNFDIITGITAPIIAYYCFTKPQWHPRIALLWNSLGIILLGNVFIHGLLSAPTPFQQILTEPANTFIGYFPYIWLPTFVVPSALLFHIFSIKKLLKK
jgi:hypothetical protein